MLTLLFIIQLDSYVFLGKQINNLLMTHEPSNSKQQGSSFIPLLEAISQSHTSSFKTSKESIYLADNTQFSPQTRKKEEWRIGRHNMHCFQAHFISQQNNLYILINGLCNTLKLAIFPLYVIYVLRMINISKHETFFLNRKLPEIFWLHFYKEAMLRPHACTLCSC
jgi:hypothetical protein